MQCLGHSNAMSPPLLIHCVATLTKLSNNLAAIRLRAKILDRVFGPNCAKFSLVHVLPPVHGMAPNNKTRDFVVTAFMALSTPCWVVRSSLIVKRVTSQTGGANCPINEFSPQQYSTILRR